MFDELKERFIQWIEDYKDENPLLWKLFWQDVICCVIGLILVFILTMIVASNPEFFFGKR